MIYSKEFGSSNLSLKPVESVVASTVSNGWYANGSDGSQTYINCDGGWEGEYLKVVQVSSPNGINVLAKKKGKYVYKTIDGFLQVGEFEVNDVILNYTYSGSSLRAHTIVVALEDCNVSVSTIQDTDWMPFRIIPYSSYYKGFVVCTKGYSKIGIKCYDSNSARQMDVYTANVRTDYDKSSSETLLGTAVGATEVQIDLQGNDYVWLWTHDTSSSNKCGWYRLLT